MKKFKTITIGIIFSIIIFSISLAIENKILFKVNNEIITSMDILTELKYLGIINKDLKKTTNNQAFEIAKRSLIREKIKEIELKRLLKEIEVDEKFLNNLLIDYFKSINIKTISEFEKFFISQDIDPNLIKKKISIEILWNQLIYSKFKQNVKIDRKSIQNELSNNVKKKEFLLSEILFNINESEKLNDKIILLKKEIKEKGFSQTALTYSISDTSNKGGKLGWVSETIMSQKIKNEVKKIKVGRHTNPIVIPGGFLIIKIEDIREVDNSSDLNDEIEKIIKDKTNEQLNQFSNIYFNKIKKDIVIHEL
ncbi:peptidylprolyl isomerase [Pelagibacterales bacterium SAG-MED21]|nr:peptidylprolyl isomerase [Pelagibacterales bacterium SAG-MED21]